MEGQRFSQRCLLSEWEDIVDAWHLESWEAYRDVARPGRKARLPERQRELLRMLESMATPCSVKA